MSVFRAFGVLLVLTAPLAAPALVEGQDVDPERPTFTPFTVRPALLNQEEVVEALTEAYPAELREEGIGGSANVWFFIDDGGLVQNTLLDQSSGNEALDAAALTVAEAFRFSPAMNRDERVPVWVSIPITFRPPEESNR